MRVSIRRPRRVLGRHGIPELAGAAALVISLYGNGAAPATAAMSSGNLIQNGSFEAGSLSPWQASVRGPAAGTVRLDTSTYFDGAASAEASVTTPDANQPWYFLFQQANVALLSYQRYSLTFWAKASTTTTRKIKVALQQKGTPFTVYASQDFDVAQAWTQFTVKMPGQTLSDSNTAVNCSM